MELYQGTKVGIAAEVQGEATLTHADGSTEVIQKGTFIYEDDTIETAEHGAVNITFNDDTVFVISNNASMVIDEYVYDASRDGEGDIDISVARGVFAYTSGFIGHEDPEDVNIETPVGSIGIRGTTFTASIPEENSGEEFKVSILEGAIAVKPKSGGEFLLDDPRESLEINPSTFEVTELGVLTPDQVIDSFNVIQTVAPELMAPVIHAPGRQGGFVNPRGSANVENARGESVNEAHNTPEPKAGPNKGQAGKNKAATEAEAVEAKDQGQKPDKTVELENADKPNGANEFDNRPNIEGPIGTEGPLGDQGPAAGNGGTAAGPHHNIDPLQILAMDGPIGPGGPGGAVGGHGGPHNGLPSVSGTNTLSNPTHNLGHGHNGTFDPAISGGAATSGGAASNRAPTATSDTYTAFEQAGLEGQTHSFNISKFFDDPDGDSLSFSVGSVTPGVLAGAPTIVGGNVFFSPLGLSADTTLSFTVTAHDGLASVTKNFQTTLYNEVPFGSETSGDDSFNISANTYSFSALAGDDDIDIFSSNNAIFGGTGSDTFDVWGNNNNIFGEQGSDTLNIQAGSGNLISGGGGHDTLNVTGTSLGDFQIFGGDGRDLISLNPNAYAVFRDSTASVIDGGRGADKLSLSQAGLIDFSAIRDGAIISVEKLDVANAKMNTLKLDINDVLTYNEHQAFFINIDGNDNIQLLNAGATGDLTPVQTDLSNPYDTTDGHSYSLYSFTTSAGTTAQLYVNVDSGNAGGTVSGI